MLVFMVVASSSGWCDALLRNRYILHYGNGISCPLCEGFPSG
jgi:hypothetical protein